MTWLFIQVLIHTKPDKIKYQGKHHKNIWLRDKAFDLKQCYITAD